MLSSHEQNEAEGRPRDFTGQIIHYVVSTSALADGFLVVRS